MAAGSLGTLTLDLIAKIGGFTEPMDRAARHAKKNAKDIGDSANEANAAWKGLGVTIMGFAGAIGAGAIFSRFIQETRDAANEQAQLAAVLNSTGNAAGFNQAQLNSMADALESVTAFSGGEFTVAQTSLLAFTGIVGDNFPRALQAAADMAARTGSTVQQTAETIGRALDVPSKGMAALSKQGFRFSDEQKAVVKQLEATGRAAEAQALILEELEKTYGGAAAAARDTFSGALVALDATISSKLTADDGLPAVVDLINDLNDSLRDGVAADMLELMGGAATVAAMAIGARLTAAVVSSTVAFTAAQIEAARYQAALASMAGVSGAAATGQLALAGATRAASGAMALLGGPVGVAVLAGGGLLYLATAADDAEKRIKRLREEARGSITDFSDLGEAGRKHRANEINKEIEAAKIQMEQYEALASRAQGMGLSQDSIDKVNADIELLQKNISKLYDELEQLSKVNEKVAAGFEEYANEDIEKFFNAAVDQQIAAQNKLYKANEQTNKSFADMRADLQKQIDLWGNKSKAVELAYDLERGLIAGLDPVRQEQLVALAEQIDLLQQQSDLMDELDEFGWDKAFNIDGISDDLKKFTTFSEDAFERINGVAADTWVNFANGAEDAFGGVKQMFIQTLAEMAHEALTKPILLNVQQSLTGAKDGGGASGSGSSSALGSVGVGGIYAAGAIAVIAAVNDWNKKQDEKFQEMTAAYRQGTQSLGTILGSANQKSDSLAEALLDLNGLSSDMLSVNYGMYQSLQSIDKGINGVAAGFARQFGLSGVGGAVGVTEFSGAGLKRLGEHGFIEDLEKYAAQLDIIGGDFITEFAGGIMNGINKGVFSKSKRIIDEGIQFTSQTLSDILADGLVEAFAYADVKTQKKVLGIKTSVKVGTETQALDDILLRQLSGVFVNAREVLDQSADVFGIEFENYINRLSISEQKLSLKDLEGDALVQEIESFFSKTLDNWAGVLLNGTDALRKYQEVGEGAFETMMRLAAETVSFTDAAKLLQLNFGAVNMEAVDAVQSLSDAAGGFDLLSSGLNNYANKFLDDADKLKNAQDKMSASFAELGLEIPKTRDEFKALIQNGVADPELFTSLLSLVDATDLYLSALEKQQKALADLIAPYESILATSGLSDYERSIYNLNKSLEDSIAKAEALGATEEQLAIIRGANEKELEKINAERQAALDELMGGYVDALAKSKMTDFQAQVYDLNKSLGDAIEQAKALGATEEQLAMIRDSSALQMQKLYASESDAALAGLRGAIDAQVARETSSAESKFAAINSAASAAFGNVSKALDSQIASANRWLETQQNLYDSQVEGIERSVSALRDMSKTLRDAADQMRYVGLVDGERSRVVAMNELDATIANLRNGGAVDPERINELIGRVTVDQSQYSSAFEYEQEVARTAAKLEELAGLTDKQATIEERSLAGIEALREAAIEGNTRLVEGYALNMREQIAAIQAAATKEIEAVDNNSKDQITELEKQYQAYVEQINVMRGIDNSVLTVADAIEKLETAIANEQAVFARVETAAAITSVAQTNVYLLDEFRKWREENFKLQYQIAKNTSETTEILWAEQQMAMEEETGT